MMKLTRKILSRVWWLGGGTATVMGLAMLLALTVGLASTALAGTGVGASLDLGKTNTVNATSKLVGSVAGPSLVIDNNSTGLRATALNLQVEPGKPPFKVNSGAKVKNLNSDKLDGKDLTQLPRGFYLNSTIVTHDPAVSGSTASYQASCDAGDQAMGGGYLGMDSTSKLLADGPLNDGRSWGVAWNSADPDEVSVRVVCADFGTPHGN